MGDPKQPDKVTLTREELDALLAKRDRDAAMDPQERRIREIVREETGNVFTEALKDFFGDLGDADPKHNTPKGDGLFDSIFGSAK